MFKNLFQKKSLVEQSVNLIEELRAPITKLVALNMAMDDSLFDSGEEIKSIEKGFKDSREALLDEIDSLKEESDNNIEAINCDKAVIKDRMDANGKIIEKLKFLFA